MPTAPSSSGSTLERALYDLLRTHLGDYLSPEHLARHLGVDTSAARAALNQLARAGAGIDHHPALGYRLERIPEALLPGELTFALETRYFGRNVVVHQEVISTNDEARRLARQQAPEGTLVVAEAQRAGRGRRGRTWHSPGRVGLWCSLLLYPPEQISPGFCTTLFGVAITRAIRLHCGAPAALKWPNDVLLAERKVAGILCELHPAAESRTALIAGFGINVNQDSFPAELRSSATSIYRHTGRTFNRAGLLKKVLLEAEQAYLCAADGGEDLILEQARALSSTLGRQVVVQTDDREVRGRACDLEADGALVVEDEAGTRRVVRAGDVHYPESTGEGGSP